MSWRIELTPTARKMLAAVGDRRIRRQIRERIDHLSSDPEKQGKPLLGELAGYRSVRAGGQRYRILYRVLNEKVLVLVVGLGLRKEKDKRDIYALAKKLLRLRLV